MKTAMKKNSFASVEVTYLRDNQKKSIRESDNAVKIDFGETDCICNAVLTAAEDITLETVSVITEYSFESGDKLFLNGYQSWSLSEERGINGTDKSLRFCPKKLLKKYSFDRYGDSFFYRDPHKKGHMHGYSYAYVRRGDKYVLFASLSEQTGFTRFVFDTKKNTVTAEKDCTGRTLTGREKYTALKLAVIEGDERYVFERWFSLLNIAPITQNKFRGYTSWYNYYQNITEKLILPDLNGLNALPEKADIFQIDDGYETYVGDWLEVDAGKFPNGMDSVAKKISEAGYTPGIWMAPFVAEKDSRLASQHPEWLVRQSSGELLVAGSNWSGIYVLDFYNKEARSYIKKCLQTATDSWGFQLLKLDFLYAVCMRPRPDKTRGEIMAEATSFLRDVCGNTAILGCGVPLASAFGKVEYCRIGADVSLEWQGPFYMRPFHSERPSTLNSMKNTVYRRQLSSRAFINDPDVFILRDSNVKLSDNQKDMLGTVNGLFGGLLFASDNFLSYSESQKKQYLKFSHLKNAQDVSVSSEGNKTAVSYTENGVKKSLSF